MSTISATGTLYFRENAGTLERSFNGTSWSSAPSFPITIENSDTSTLLKVYFTTDITLSDMNSYFICGSSDIQFGSTSLKSDGTRVIITIDGIFNYPGFIRNGDSGNSAFNNIYVYNLEVHSINGSTNTNDEGWIGQQYFGNNANENYIINCASDGNISGLGGGIVGASAGLSGSLNIIGCSSTGQIGTAGGGIVGSYAGRFNGNVTCKGCWSEGNLTNLGGGIFGNFAGDSGSVTALNCYSMGDIADEGGGIFGGYAATINGFAIANNCYSRGNIAIDAGGIFGRYAGVPGGIPNAQNCYSSGTVTTPGTGIFGSDPDGGQIQSYCYIADGSWNSSSANTSLQGVPNPDIGDTWASTAFNTPYELVNIGYTPYTPEIITSTPTLLNTYSSSVEQGAVSAGAIASGKSYTIVKKGGGDSASYDLITIDSTSGVVSVAAAVATGTYTLYIRNTGSYYYSIFTISVTGPVATSTTCCNIPLQLKGVDYTLRNQILSGNVLIGESGVRRQPMSYSDILNKKMAYASKWA